MSILRNEFVSGLLNGLVIAVPTLLAVYFNLDRLVK